MGLGIPPLKIKICVRVKPSDIQNPSSDFGRRGQIHLLDHAPRWSSSAYHYYYYYYYYHYHYYYYDY